MNSSGLRRRENLPSGAMRRRRHHVLQFDYLVVTRTRNNLPQGGSLLDSEFNVPESFADQASKPMPHLLTGVGESVVMSAPEFSDMSMQLPSAHLVADTDAAAL